MYIMRTYLSRVGFTKLLETGRLTAVTGPTGPVAVSRPYRNGSSGYRPVATNGRPVTVFETHRPMLYAIWARRKLGINGCNSLVLWTAMRIMGCNPTGEDG
jgi:hypothetical protein